MRDPLAWDGVDFTSQVNEIDEQRLPWNPSHMGLHCIASHYRYLSVVKDAIRHLFINFIAE
jgi:hypothetical protein